MTKEHSTCCKEKELNKLKQENASLKNEVKTLNILIKNIKTLLMSKISQAKTQLKQLK